MKRIGIFSGTFDPIHNGHLAFAESALEAGLEKVWFIVEPQPRRKQGVHALEHRQAMVKLAIKKERRFGQIILEQARFTPNETIPILKARFKNRQLALLFGSDVLNHIAHWPNIQKLANSVELLIAGRQQQIKDLEQTLSQLEKTRSLHFKYAFIESDKPNVSSSKLRLALKHQQPVTEIPPAVKKYIKRENLYVSVD